MKRVARRQRLTGGIVLMATLLGAGCGAYAQSAPNGKADIELQKPCSPFPARLVRRGRLEINIGETRIVMRGPMFPGLARLSDDALVLMASAAEEGGRVTGVRSEDLGGTWKPMDMDADWRGCCLIQAKDELVIALHYETKPLPDRPGWRSTKRWESTDNGKTVRGPSEDGTLYLPPDQFEADKAQWFHGNIIKMPNGDMLAAMQGTHVCGATTRFRSFISKSTDYGKSWKYLSTVATLKDVDDPEGVTKKGWSLWGPVEPNIVHHGGGRIVCVMRMVNDDASAPKAKLMDTYHDLSYTISGNGIYPGKLAADQYYIPGPPSVPLVISYSSNYGKTWSRARPMKQARGCAPRMALSEGILALTYGGLAFPRWGNCIAFSTDGGKSWTDEINVGPFLTTGYTALEVIGPGKFLMIFDCTPPQPWKNHAAHWVGAVDVEVVPGPPGAR